MTRNRAAWIAALFLCLALNGCITLKDPEASLEYSADVVGTLSVDQTIGQTLVSRRPGFNGLQVWLRQSTLPSSPDQNLTFELYHTPQDTQPLVTVPISYSLMVRSFPLTISFHPQDDPPFQSYYLLLKIPSGTVQVLGRAEDAYPHGQLWVNDNPQQADAAFRLTYDYGLKAMLDDAGKVLRSLWLILPLLIILWLPGQLLLSLGSDLMKLDENSLDWAQRTAISIGLSLALIPLAMLWTTALGLRWNHIGVLLAAILLVGIYFWKTILRYRRLGFPSLTVHKTGLVQPSDVALVGIFLFSLAIRLVMVRDLAAPAWVDPVHHATIIRLIVEQGAFPQNYAPYVEATTAGYHPGFHSVVAAFHWLSGLDIASAMFLLGQMLNALSVLAVYLFTITFTTDHSSQIKDRTAGLIAALMTGVFSPMPAYYASWGRYTQLTGLVILPACIALVAWLLEDVWQTQSVMKRRVKDLWMLVLLSMIACGGLAITHYRVIIFLAVLILAYLFAQTLRSLDKKPLWSTLPSAMVLVGAVGLGAILITLPWWPDFYATAFAPKLSLIRPAPQPLKIDWGYLTPAYGKPVMILACLGLAWSILRARWFGLTLVLWTGLLLISANQGIIRMPGFLFVNKTSVEIMLFIPFSVLAGYLVSSLIRAVKNILPTNFHTPYLLSLGLLACVLAGFGARSLIPILNPVTFLIREADKPAIAWISDQLSPEENILINPFYWSNHVYAGQDGGYWITPMAGRKSLPPPVLYNFGDVENISRINKICQQVIDGGKDPHILHALMLEQGIHYVYIGARGGVLSPKALRDSHLFQVIYQQDGVWIFEIR